MRLSLQETSSRFKNLRVWSNKGSEKFQALCLSFVSHEVDASNNCSFLLTSVEDSLS